MTRRELFERQKKIDQGIFLAQKRMVERAKLMNYTLVVFRNGKVREVKPSEISFSL